MSVLFSSQHRPGHHYEHLPMISARTTHSLQDQRHQRVTGSLQDPHGKIGQAQSFNLNDILHSKNTRHE